MKFLFVVLAVFCVAAQAGNVPFTDCSNGAGHVKVSTITAQPYPPVKGSPVAIAVKGALNEQVTSSNYTLTVSFSGITLLTKTGDLCKLSPSFVCPHAAGPISVGETITVPSIAPSGAYDIQIKAIDQSGAPLLCVSINLSIGESDETSDESPAITVEMIERINAMQNTWTAGFQKRFDGKTIKHVKGLLGAWLDIPQDKKLPVKQIARDVTLALPTDFDARAEWGHMCPSIADIRDQGSCGSCWAVAAAETMTDRTCLAFNGTSQPYLASEDVLSCCGFSCGNGCEGGYPGAAWQYFEQTGVVTGGPWNSKQGCMPYEVASCDHHVAGNKPPCGPIVPTPACTKTCQDGSSWSSSKHFGASAYSVPGDVTTIQQEIMTHGPVEGTFTVYADFPTYKSGVYKHTTGQALGGHAIKIMGWGVEAGSPYWLVANSWNSAWGDKGTFKIARGVDECGIESGIVAGLVHAA